ncbi:MAG: 50S ribosomal protein L15 [Bacilli bacterium]
MNLSDLKPNKGAKHYKKIIGRGSSSGTGTTAGKGEHGQNARSGGGVRPGFEGGQTPLFKRLPKRGFTNVNRKEYATINIQELNKFEKGTVVTFDKLRKEGLVKKSYDGLKVLGNGKLEVSLTIKANKYTKSAKAAIEAAGGKAEVI